MGIQINGQTDTISANDGGLNINNTGITTANNIFANDLTINNLTGVAATFTGVVSYEDVTSIDSIGIITARAGVKVGAGESISAVSGTIYYYGDGSNLTGLSVESWNQFDTWLYGGG